MKKSFSLPGLPVAPVSKLSKGSPVKGKPSRPDVLKYGGKKKK